MQCESAVGGDYVTENGAFLPQAVLCAVVFMMSTNRSVGSQPEVKSRRIFYSSAPQFLAKGPAGKKC